MSSNFELKSKFEKKNQTHKKKSKTKVNIKRIRTEFKKK